MPSVKLPGVAAPAGKLLKRLVAVPPKEVKLTIGVDIGSSSVKVVALGPRRGNGARPVVAQHLVAVPEGQEVDASEAIKAAVAGLHLPVRTVTVGVSGQWVVLRVVEMPAMKPSEIKQALPFEAQRYLPFNTQDVVLDGQVLGAVDANKIWVLIVACKKELIERRLDWVKRAGLDVGIIDADALALANSFLSASNGRSSEESTALLNVGAQLTNLIVFQGTIPYLVRDIPWGAEKFARAVAEQAGIDIALVQQQLVGEQPANANLTATTRAAAEALVTEAQLSFDYFESRFGRPPEKILVTGGLGLSSLFVEALKSHFSQPITPWQPTQDLSGQFAIAYGLALR